MKTKSATSRTLRRTFSIMFLGATIFASFLARPLLAQDHQLVFTENSPLSLTVTYDGSSDGITVAPESADTWLVTFPLTTHLGFQLDWQEPGDPTLVNDFNIVSGNPNTWIVSSGFTLPGGPAQDSMQPPDGHTFAMIGSDFLDSMPIDATFHDLDNTAAVPEPATWIAGVLTLGAILACRGRSLLPFSFPRSRSVENNA